MLRYLMVVGLIALSFTVALQACPIAATITAVLAYILADRPVAELLLFLLLAAVYGCCGERSAEAFARLCEKRMAVSIM